MATLAKKLLEQLELQTKQLKKQTEHAEYQTKLLESLVGSIDAAQQKSRTEAAKMKVHGMDLLSKLIGNHPMLNKLKKDMEKPEKPE